MGINMFELADKLIAEHSENIDSIANKINSENKEERIEAIELLLRVSAAIGYQYDIDLDHARGLKK